MARAWPLLVLVAAPGCDWDYYALVNSLPVANHPSSNPVVHVLFAVDSLSSRVVEEARAQGAFREASWRFAKNAVGFPGSSDVSWTRLLHGEPIGGSEYEYYDTTKNELILEGYPGLMVHAFPWEEKPVYQGFDYRGDGVMNLYYVYADSWYSLQNALDATFTLVHARSQTAGENVFLAYFNEVDALGHMAKLEDSVAAILEIDRRIRAFRHAYPQQTFLFTLVSDHGQDFMPCKGNCLIKFDSEMPGLGIKPVESLAGHDSAGQLVAVPIMYTRVNYMSLYALPEQAARVAQRASRPDYVDWAISPVAAPSDFAGPAGLPWYGLWQQEKLAVQFGYEAGSDTYYVDSQGDLAALDVELPATAERYQALSDEELFAWSVDRTYPDVFYRTRTALEPVGVRFPANVLLSYRHPHGSLGFNLPGGNDIGTESWHGGLHALDTFGVVLSEEGQLPSVIRGDTFLDILPVFRERLEQRGVYSGRNDPNEELDYKAVARLQGAR
jgi:hypothetical protein